MKDSICVPFLLLLWCLFKHMHMVGDLMPRVKSGWCVACQPTVKNTVLFPRICQSCVHSGRSSLTRKQEQKLQGKGKTRQDTHKGRQKYGFLMALACFCPFLFCFVTLLFKPSNLDRGFQRQGVLHLEQFSIKNFYK